MSRQQTELNNLQQLQANLAQTLGQLELLTEQKAVIREEIAKVQGRLEILNLPAEKKENEQ